MKRRSAALLGALLLALPATAQVTKWVDADGRVHYGDRPPAGKAISTAPLRGTLSVGDGMTVVEQEFQSAPAPAKPAALPLPRRGEIWIYTTPRCRYCRIAKEHMLLKGLKFAEKDITANPRHQAEFKALGGRGVPVTLAGARRFDGYREEGFEAFLKSAGF
ncbi:glutaredoxin family protein [Pseudomonas sp.]|uniref:glutaredoxin family protein n=1 Tax=Pseudomonas sp. TaxID=306 RepID=UPI0023533DBA|nr:glutaredoxin family protein [Pseudomonas sp.]